MDRSSKSAMSGGSIIHPYLHLRRPRVHPYFKLRSHLAEHVAGEMSWNVPDLCAAYDWPKDLLKEHGKAGGVIALVELGGGWVQSDMATFFKSIDQPVPHITDVSVDGTVNKPVAGDDSPDGEVALDIQVAGAAYYVATGKAATIRVYWAQDIASAVRAAASDGCDVCSISWGADEALWGQQAAQDMEDAATEATASGMVIFAASGDNDSRDGGPNPANVDLPSSCPHVIGCGGTSKTEDSETVWNNNPGKTTGEGTGGGFSTFFPMPAWQVGAPHGSGRMVPDVAADADPNTGYNIVLHGSPEVMGGTSAVAPLYAGLFASFGTKLGFLLPELWSNPVCFNDITKGDNGAYRAGVGPDACTGLGSPIGQRLADLLTSSVASHVRQLRELKAENAKLRQGILEAPRTPELRS